MRIFLIFLCALFSFSGYSQTDTEKAVLAYINQARTNPTQFLNDVAKPYISANNLERNRYARSLVKDLEQLSPLTPLSFDPSLQKMAEEFSQEAGKKGWTSHIKTKDRFEKFADHIEITGENLQFGLSQPLAIVMDLLVDIDVPDVGHRKNLLDEDFSLIGISISNHKTYEYITVMEFGGFKD